MNVESSRSLFRKEVLEQRVERLHGDVSLAVPISWQLIGYLLLAALAAALVFIVSASYSQVTTVKGTIVLETGVASIVPSRAGVIAALDVREGSRVEIGNPLVQIRSEEDAAQGATTPERVIQALRQQDQGLATQSSLLMRAAGAARARLAVQADGAANEIVSLDRQIADQRRLIIMAEKQFREVESLVDKGFISRRDFDARESAVLSRRQQLSQLEQARAAKSAIVDEANRAVAEADATAQAQAAGARSARAELDQQLARAESGRGYTVTSPVSGTVTALSANVGQPVVPGQPLMVVAPTGAKMRVELDVPTSAIGFLSPGQEMRLAIDAYPYQRFGTLKARVAEIAGTVVERGSGRDQATPVYLVSAKLEQPWIVAFGRRRALLPGMTLTARIVTDRRSLIEWLFEPVFAVQRR